MSRVKKAVAPPPRKGGLTELQRFTVERWPRSRITPHPKNPRTLDSAAEKRLQAKMQQVGMLQPVVVNRRTGRLLGGHQRLAIMDRLEGYKTGRAETDYELDVAVVELDEAAELEMLVFLNNPSAQGDWDLDKLAALRLSDGVSFDGMGFDPVDVDLLFDGDARFSALFSDAPEVKQTKEQLQEIRDAKREAREKLADEETNADHYFVVVCKDDSEKAALMKRLGVPNYEQFVPADAVEGALERAGRLL